MSDYPNMSYCKFENTLLAMKQIQEDLLDEYSAKDLNTTEAKARRKIIEMVQEWAEELQYLDGDQEPNYDS